MGWPEIPDKLFFKIGEVSQITGVKSHVLRYWESEFPALSPPKNRSAQRVYRRKDIETVLTIKELLYEQNYTIEGARKRLRLLRKAGSRRGQLDLFPSAEERKQMAAAVRDLERALILLEKK
jgi:DNA-binding transcriptional MerR regulator